MRCQLVDAGLALYRSAGLEAVSLRRLADAVGISHTLPYRYFARNHPCVSPGVPSDLAVARRRQRSRGR